MQTRSAFGQSCSLAIAAVVAVSSGLPRLAHAQEQTSTVELLSPDSNVTLNRITGQAFASASGPGGYATAAAQSWETVCIAPCNKTLPRGSYYFVSGPGIRRSNDFLLPPGNAKLTVRPGSAGGWAGGFLLTVFGGIAAITGLAFGLVGSGAHEGESAKGWATPGWITFGVGAGATVVGIILMASNSTDVVDERGVVIGKSKSKDAPRLTPVGLLF